MNKPIVGETYFGHKVLSGSWGAWTVQCVLCGTVKIRRANQLMGSASIKVKRCWCQAAKLKWNVGDMARGMPIIGGPNVEGEWLLKCRCGKEIWRKPETQVDGCGCGIIKYLPGHMVHGRRVVKCGSKKNAAITVECLSCGKHAKINPHRPPSKCRHCQGWDGRMGAVGDIYAITCPYTGEAKYVGSTRDKSYRRVMGHFRERNADGNKDKPLYQWMKMLAGEGAMPGCILLESVKSGDVHGREIFWIHKLKSEGCMLFNLNHLEEVQS